MLETAGVECPYCGERFETTADTSGGDQDYIEDCKKKEKKKRRKKKKKKEKKKKKKKKKN